MEFMMDQLRFLLIFASFAVLTINCENAQNATVPKHHRKSYVCPPEFVRLSYKCYYFSREAATWKDAYWKCHDMRSNLAIIKNGNQDKILRRTLGKSTVAPLERWLGGRYDWEQMAWKWAASGKYVSYRGFDDINDSDKERLRWQCIVLDPELEYKWNSRSCLDKYHYICQTKLKTVSRKGKKKLQKQYNATKYNQLNEVPVPVLPEIVANDIYYKKPQPVGLSNALLYDNNNFDNTAAAVRSRQTYRVKKHKKSNDVNDDNSTNDAEKKLKQRRNRMKLKKRYNNNNVDAGNNSTAKTADLQQQRRRNKQRNFNGMKWKSYYDKSTISPLHPRRIIQEFTY